jgi:hypothetical protein
MTSYAGPECRSLPSCFAAPAVSPMALTALDGSNLNKLVPSSSAWVPNRPTAAASRLTGSLIDRSLSSTVWSPAVAPLPPLAICRLIFPAFRPRLLYAAWLPADMSIDRIENSLRASATMSVSRAPPLSPWENRPSAVLLSRPSFLSWTGYSWKVSRRSSALGPSFWNPTVRVSSAACALGASPFLSCAATACDCRLRSVPNVVAKSAISPEITRSCLVAFFGTRLPCTVARTASAADSMSSVMPFAYSCPAILP